MIDMWLALTFLSTLSLQNLATTRLSPFPSPPALSPCTARVQRALLSLANQT